MIQYGVRNDYSKCPPFAFRHPECSRELIAYATTKPTPAEEFTCPPNAWKEEKNVYFCTTNPPSFRWRRLH